MSIVPGAGSLPTGEELRQALERVLARPEFRKDDASFWEPILEAIGDSLDAIFEAIGDAFGGTLTSLFSETVVMVVLLLILGALVVHLARSVLQLRVPSADGAADPAGTPEEAQAAGRSEADLAEAARLAAAGAFAEAMHALYRGTVAWLDRHGSVRRERFKTGAEYANDLGPPLRPAFRSLLSAYYPVAFGGRRAGETEWLAMRRAALALGLPA